jgi:hypothetical protein
MPETFRISIWHQVSRLLGIGVTVPPALFGTASEMID